MFALEQALDGLMALYTGLIDTRECWNTPQHSDQIPILEKELLLCVASSSDVKDVVSIV